jgi:C-terminal processing protease CtpA/Prc
MFDKSYVREALQLMQEHSLHRNNIDWAKLTSLTLATEGSAHDAVRYALEQLGDRHSFLRVPTPGNDHASVSPQLTPTGHLLPRSSLPIGVVKIPGFSVFSLAAPEASEFVRTAHALLQDLAAAHVVGWIIDLRDNWGGNMWPMLAAVGPLLGARDVGHYDNASSRQTWWHENGAVGIRDQGQEYTLLNVEPQPNADLNACASAPVAVVINGATASSGEATAVSFRGRQRTRFFGCPTYGLSTDNQTFALADGSELLLTVAVFVDRNGQKYESGMTPDEPTEGDDEHSIGAAAHWLIQQVGR